MERAAAERKRKEAEAEAERLRKEAAAEAERLRKEEEEKMINRCFYKECARTHTPTHNASTYPLTSFASHRLHIPSNIICFTTPPHTL
jgi:hypothetical protein